MGASFPAVTLANVLSLPVRHLAVVHPDARRVRMLVARVVRGRPRVIDARIVDAEEESLTSRDEIRQEVLRQLQEIGPEAVVLVLPQHQLLRHVLDVPPSDAAQTRAHVEREASHIGGLSESAWAFDFARLRPFAGHAHPLAAVFCRQADLRDALEAFVENEEELLDVLPAGDALAVAFRAAAPDTPGAILVDLGTEHTGITIVSDGQPVFSTSFPTGFRELMPAETTTPSAPDAGPAIGDARAGAGAWMAELERTIQEWAEDHPALASEARQWPAFLAGLGASRADWAEQLNRLGARTFATWPVRSRLPDGVAAEAAAAWGALLAATGLSTPIPSFLPRPRRDYWIQQRFWRGLLTVDWILAGLLAVLLGSAVHHQRQALEAKAAWRAEATRALEEARTIRGAAEALNARQELLRPLFERQRHTIETLQVLAALQRQRTNAEHWYVLLGDSASYAAGSNHFAALPPAPPARPPEVRAGTSATNPPPVTDRSFVAEVCLVPQGEKMRQALSDLVADLKRFPLFRNVDVLPSERRRPWVATNLVFPERHFALELNLAESDLLPPLLLPRLAATNREPRASGPAGFRAPMRAPGLEAASGGTNAPSGPGPGAGNARNGRPR